MSKSLLKNIRCCYVCSDQNIEKHHIYFGTRNRSKAEQDGCWVYLCPTHHRSERGVHGAMGGKLKLSLQRKCQIAWEKTYGKTTEDFIKRYGKNYLVEEVDEENRNGGYPFND